MHVCTLGPERVVGTSLLDCRIMQFTKCFISVLICVPSKLPNSSTNSDHLHLTSDASTGRLIGLCKMTELVCVDDRDSVCVCFNCLVVSDSLNIPFVHVFGTRIFQFLYSKPLPFP